MKSIPLTQGKVTFVDDDVFEWASKMNWQARYAPHGNNWYAVRMIRLGPKRHTTELLHRRIIGAYGKQKTDHRDGDGLNNIKSNLRVCTDAENEKNKKKRSDNTSGFKGVYFKKDIQKFRASICSGGKRYVLGHFSSLLEAATTYNAAAKKYHGEFARLNVIAEIRK